MQNVIAADPATEPLLQQSDLQYLGAFKVPDGKLGTVSQINPSFGSDAGRAMSYNPINNSLFMEGNKFEVLLAELCVPTNIVNSTNMSALDTASVLQNPLDVTGGLGCFIGPLQNNPAYALFGTSVSKCSSNHLEDQQMTIYLSAKSGNSISVTRASGVWDTGLVLPGYTLIEPNGGQATIVAVNSTTLTINITNAFVNDILVNNMPIAQYPGWVIYNYGGTNLSDGGVLIGGTLVDNVHNKLIGTTYTAYDGQSDTTYSHFTANLNWNSSVGTQGMYRLGTTIIDNGALSAGFVDGYMGWIPTEWQSSFGKTALTGNAAMAIITRTSYGPSAFAFNPSDLGNGTLGSFDNPVSISPLVYYPGSHQTLGVYGAPGTNPAYNMSTEIKGIVFPQGSRGVLFFGRTGLGESCYGSGTINQAEAIGNSGIADWIIAHNSQLAYDNCNIPVNDATWKIASCIVAGGGIPYTCGSAIMDAAGNDSCCYDPAISDKGTHTYPYAYYVWAYDANDLLHVKNADIIGTDRSSNIDTSCATGAVYYPWCIKPYAQWDLTTLLAPYAAAGNDGIAGHGDNKINGAAYDSATQRIFISQANASYGLPLIHVFHVNLPSTSDSTPPAAPSGLSVM
ncbi:MAG: hypothetical protein US25_C0012G0003 [Candidatus Moranbacteria bacterium GW2011_GWE1_36_7]|nr:MAG: hypothetical protein UR99_C0003G0014 [Candidatus Moranbacteria bacterium GW2011_GWD2_36_12]KKQ06956.1 MAG: hypothetical protein US16_C0005G0014 [Candidatus Moranbacteria bacterium GW2011_GWE2_36_40]KKQ15115.1 MAG: hypothetical protein US25_C0012G0003 [Candidatus Moranbacteria bacterium GW2011_GWE1_36_7]